MIEEKDYIKAAAALGCEVAAIQAVAEVESRGAGFLMNGKPTLLYEPHIFSRLTKHIFDATHPRLSYPKWRQGTYGTKTEQWVKLEEAVKLDRSATLQSCSWGKFQILGLHWQKLGYASIDEFVLAMHVSEAEHLDAFVRYVLNFHLARPLRDKNWARFALLYNGAGYRLTKYDVKMADAFRRFSRA